MPSIVSTTITVLFAAGWAAAGYVVRGLTQKPTSLSSEDLATLRDAALDLPPAEQLRLAGALAEAGHDELAAMIARRAEGTLMGGGSRPMRAAKKSGAAEASRSVP